MKVYIAAQACLLLLHRETDCYPSLRSILVYSSTYSVRTTRHLGAGVMEERQESRLGEAWDIKCVFSPSPADLCYNAFDCVVIDEGVKMKGEETLVGRGVRSMTPRFRLVLTATPVKNRLPDIFRLAWWAVGGKAEATPIFPYRDESAERDRFAATFMVTERNLTQEEEAKAEGKKVGRRFRKFTAEVCNVHRLWKLFGPIILRRRKQDTGIDIVPKIRRVIRCEMGTLQKKVYECHLRADYRDVNGRPAIGAQLAPGPAHCRRRSVQRSSGRPAG
jgi:hypothetical protein